MTEPPDFFISYTEADERWAEWIAWQLERAAFRVRIQKWDFRPGSNFVLEMQRASVEAVRTLVVLSPAYVASGFGAAEWAVAFAADPTSLKRKLVPVRVADCRPPGLLEPIISIDLWGKTELDARRCLLEGIQAARAKPAVKPEWPGEPSPPRHFGSREPIFPGEPIVTSRRRKREPYEGLLVYVSLGGTCRDPMAKVITEQLLEKTGGPRIRVESCGLGPESGGRQPSPGARLAIMNRYGKDLLRGHRAKSLDRLLKDADLVLVMTAGILKSLPERATKNKAFALKAFLGQAGEVEDPWPHSGGAPSPHYEQCCSELESLLREGLPRIINFVRHSRSSE